MPYLIRPPPNFAEASNPLYSYIVLTLDGDTITILRDLHAWDWQVSYHQADDTTYLAAVQALDKAVKQRRRRTQMIHGDLMGEPVIPTLREIWEKESRSYAVEEDTDGGGMMPDPLPQILSTTRAVSDTPDDDNDDGDGDDSVDEWYNAEVSRLRAIALVMNKRWRVLPVVPAITPTIPTTTTTKEGKTGRESKYQDLLDWRASFAEKLDRMSVFEDLPIERIPFSMRPMGLF